MSKTWVQLGRNGDIMTILPLLWAHGDKRQGAPKPRLMVAREYASLLEGVSYVEPVIFDGEAHEIARAIDGIEGEVICTQVNGPLDVVKEYVYKPAGKDRATTTSYQKEMWKIAGMLEHWGTHLDFPHGHLPLVFDQRNKEREAKLLAKLPKSNKKLVLLASTGISSPFPFTYKRLLLHMLNRTKFKIVDLADFKADRLFDLLALYEQAYALVTVDSAPLHLANAVPNLPVFAFTSDKPTPWNGSSWRANHVFYCRYSDFPDRVPELIDTLEAFKPVKPMGETTVQVYNGMAGGPPVQSGFEVLAIQQGMVGRLDVDGYPYLKDCLKMGIQKAGKNGMVLLTRPGVEFGKSASSMATLLEGPAYGYRISGGKFSPVLDFFAAPATWWQERFDEIPELYLNSDYFWSQAIWAIFRKHHARDLTGFCERPPSEPKPPTQGVSESTQANFKAKGDIITKLGIYSRYPKISEQVQEIPIVGELQPGGYNPSIVRGETLFMAYRYHPEQTAATRLAVATINVNNDYKVLSDCPIKSGKLASNEDPRLFEGPNGSLWCSFIDSTWPVVPPAACVRIGFFAAGNELVNVTTPKIGNNDLSCIEKNWIFWYDDGELYCMYLTSPQQIIYVNDEVLATPGPKWPYGDPRGGTAPLEYDGYLLRFFHSSTRNEFEGPRHRYFVGAYIMKPEPPFEVVAVSRKPILYGSEMDNWKVKDRPHHWKPNVIFPAGAVATEKGWILSCGVNDAACALLEITPEMLNL